MSGDPGHPRAAMSSEERFEIASWILARLILLDDTSRFPDVCELREVAREILVEQLRELHEEAGPAPPIPRHPPQARAG